MKTLFRRVDGWLGMLLAVLLAVAAAPALAAPVFDTPRHVLLSPGSARIQVEATVPVTRKDGQPVLVLTLPQDAQDPVVALAPPHAGAILSWRMAQQPADPAVKADGLLARQRGDLTNKADALKAEVDTLKARMALWSTPPQGALTSEQMDQREARLNNSLPAAAVELAQKTRALEALQQQLAALPNTVQKVNRLVVTLQGEVKDGAMLPVRCAYTLPNCGWQPIYAVDASGDAVHVRLEADIRQYSGMDWTGARVELVTQDAGQRAPQAVRPWLIQKSSVVARKMEAVMAAPAPMMAKGVGLREDKLAPVAFESDTLAGWVLPNTVTVPEGETRLPILQETWNDALQRVARPARNDRRVWLMAKHEITGQPLPAGKAVFSLDGAPLGEGVFAPQGNDVTLFFGADPLVEVKTTPDTRLTGKSGIINKRQTWKWGWTYTAINKRSTAVTIRIEEPAPQAGDEGINVVCEDTPPSTKGEDNTLYWDVNVPARGEAEVRHLVTVTAPEGMPVIPGR